MIDSFFVEALRAILEKGVSVPPVTEATSPHSRFGAGGVSTLEIRNWQGECRNIRSRVLQNSLRAIWLDQAIGMALWQFGATTSLEQVAFYNPRAADFSDDGESVRAPWGLRLFAGEPSSFEKCLATLRKDPSTFRAVVPVFQPQDVGVQSRDVPCLLTLQFLLRQGSLAMVCHLRAMNPYWIFPYDHFFLTILLEWSASILGVDCGGLEYCVNSMHISSRDQAVVAKACQTEPAIAIEMPPMPKGLSSRYFLDLQVLERRVRAVLAAMRTEGVSPGTWMDLLADVPDAWSGELFRALVHAYAARHMTGNVALPFDCPAWAQASMDQSRSKALTRA